MNATNNIKVNLVNNLGIDISGLKDYQYNTIMSIVSSWTHVKDTPIAEGTLSSEGGKIVISNLNATEFSILTHLLGTWTNNIRNNNDK